MTTYEKLKQQFTPGITLHGMMEDLKSKLKYSNTQPLPPSSQGHEQDNEIEIIFLKYLPSNDIELDEHLSNPE